MLEETALTQTSETATSEVVPPVLNVEGEAVTTIDATEGTEGAEATTEAPARTALNGGGEAGDEAGAEESAEAAVEKVEPAAVPEIYELTAPEGTVIDPAMIEMATPIFKEMGLDNERANLLMPAAAQFAQKVQADTIAEMTAAAHAEWADWEKEAQADPEIGGANWKKSLATAAMALDRLGFPEGHPFRQLLDTRGMGNNSEMIRAWKRVGEAIGEDGFVRSETSGTTKKTDAELFYGENYNKGA